MTSLRLRHAGGARSSGSSPTCSTRSSTPRSSIAKSSSSSRATSASCRPTPSRWRARSSTSASRATSSRSPSASRTYARCGIITNVTPFEPEWEGYVTLEISQHHAAAGQDLRQRRHLPGALLRGRRRRRLRNQLRRQGRQVPGADRRDAAEALASRNPCDTSCFSSRWRPLPLVAQQPPATTPSQPARPLNLQPALKPPVADTGIFSPLPFPPANERRRADGAPGPRYWQQRADYTHQGHARHRRQTAQRERADPLHQQLARHAPVRVDAGGSEPVPAGQHGSLLFAAESRFGGAGFPGGFEIASLTQTAAPERPVARQEHGSAPRRRPRCRSSSGSTIR